MIGNRKWTYRHTMGACYLGYIVQAVGNNFAPLLFVIFQRSWALSLENISFLIAFNFCIQILTDITAARAVPALGYRKCIVAAHVFAAAGLLGLSVFPFIFPTPFAGLLTATALYAVGGGLTEVLISPIIEACPTDDKTAAMGILHSFYCWGVVAVILLSTVFFSVFGTEKWRVLAVLWAVLPLVNTVLFSVVPIRTLEETAQETLSLKKLFCLKTFGILVLLMVCAGAVELGMAQWASSFAEEGLHVSKRMGDLLGPCLFAALQGTARTVYAKNSGRIHLERYMIVCAAGCAACYLLASVSGNPLLSLIGCGLCGAFVGVMWPGTFSLAMRYCPGGGTAMFAFLALAGDFGGAAGPLLIGMLAEYGGGDLKKGLAAGILYAAVMIAGLAGVGKYAAAGEKSSR